MSTEEIIFYKKGGRPQSLTASEAHKSKLEAKKRWREANKNRIMLYNQMYNEETQKIKLQSRNSKKDKHKKGSKKNSKKHSRKGSKKHSRKGSKKHSRKGSKKHSRKSPKGGSKKHSRKGSKKSSRKHKN